MQKNVRKFFPTPSIRLNTLVVIEVVMLLVVSLGVMFFFTRKALVEEKKMDAEQRLEATVQHIDNILLTIEQSADNICYELLNHLDRPEDMPAFCRRLVESNPDIDGCAIAFKPNFFPNRELFINFIHRKKYNSPELIFTNKPVNYTSQPWFSETMRTCRAAWIDPGRSNAHGLEPVITYCLPIRDKDHKCVGVIGVGLSVNLLSQIVLATKPSPNSYSILLSKDGSYIIHPNPARLRGQNVFTEPEVTESPSAVEAARAMLNGETGNMSFKMNDYTWYLFYKPFVRNNFTGHTAALQNWSIATICHKDDIFGEYNHLVFHVLGIVFIALLIFYMLCKMAIRKQMKPLQYLIESSDRIADGHYDENIPDLSRDDEVGTFYKHYQTMLKALEKDVAMQDEQRATLLQRHDRLQKMHEQIDEDNQVKATFLHNITNRMIAPADSIVDSVKTLCEGTQDFTLAEADKEIDNIKQQSNTILELLSHKFNITDTGGAAVRTNASPSEAGKEDSHE
jgi:methyl-accepting chemotaxis protein/sigma-B regulation protein RsbU (phosphoserine phosphatase)